MAERKIGGTTYRTEQLLARDSLALMGKMIKVGGAGWEKMRAVLNDDVKRGDINMNVIAIDAIIDVVRNNPTAEVLALVDEIAGLAQRLAPSGSYDPVEVDQFTGRMSDLFELLAWVLQEQFSSFFGELGQIGNRKPRAA